MEGQLVKDVLAEGIRAFELGIPYNENPHPSLPNSATHSVITVYNTNGVVTDQYTIRDDIDWREIWEIGWNVGEYVVTRKETARSLQMSGT